MPVLEVKARRIGGATYQVPIEVRADRRQALGTSLADIVSHASAVRRQWLTDWPTRLMDAANNAGAAVKRERRHAQNGRGQQSICSLQMVMQARAAV